jgi:hypothetical protein
MITYSDKQLIITIPQVIPGAYHESLLKSIAHVMRLVATSQYTDNMPFDSDALCCFADLQDALMPNEFQLSKIYDDDKQK